MSEAKRPSAGRRRGGGTRGGAARARDVRPAARPGLLLAGDVGGTKTNVALFEPRARGVRMVELERFPSAEHAGLGEIVAAFLSKRRVRLVGAAFGIAGPVVDGRSRITNLPWVIDARRLGRRLGVPVTVVNDLVATAWAIPELPPRMVATLQRGARAASGSRSLALIAAGTGLGEALIRRESGQWLASASEGGHTDYAARTDEEIELLRFLRARYGRVSVERVVSGPGLVNIDDFLASRDTAERAPVAASEGERSHDELRDRAAEIGRAALDGSSPRAAHALRVFAAAYGAEAGNLALKGFATGGVYLGGGIAPKILPALEDGVFMEAFRDKGRFRAALSAIPVRVILDEHAALIGAARIARTQ